MKDEILQQIIRENPDDPRLGEPKRQLEIIQKEIETRNESSNENPDGLVVGLKTLNLMGSTEM